MERPMMHHPKVGSVRDGPPNHSAPHASHGHPPVTINKKNYKLLVDNMLVKGAEKLYRFEGMVENDPTYPVVTVRDPRKSKLWMQLETMDLVIPRFKIDENYVGEPPPLEVTILNINDNIDKDFLHREIVLKQKCGAIEELVLYTHDLCRKKHVGVARVVFEETHSARTCVAKLDGVTLMGRVLDVFLDPFGEKCKQKVLEIGSHLEEEIRKEEEAKEARKRPNPPPMPPQPLPAPIANEKPRQKLDHSEPEKTYDDDRPLVGGSGPYPLPSSVRGGEVPSKGPAGTGSFYGNHTDQYGYGSSYGGRGYDHYPQYPPGYQGYPAAGYGTEYAPPVVPPPPVPWGGMSTLPDGPQPPRWREDPIVPTEPPSWECENVPPEKVEPKEEEEKNPLDLDTRIAMLLQSKDSVIVPSFLQLGLDDDVQEGKHKEEHESPEGESGKSKEEDGKEGTSTSSSSGDSGSSSLGSGSDLEDVLSFGSDGDEEEEGGEGEGALSTPPSPFLNEEVYLLWFRQSLQRKLEALEVEREKRERYVRLRKKRKRRREREKERERREKEKWEVINSGAEDDDRMSLSSLSSAEDPILAQDVSIPPPLPVDPPAPPPPMYPYPGTYPPPQGFPPVYVPQGYPVPADPGYAWASSQGYPSNVPPFQAYPDGYAYPTGYSAPPGMPGYPPAYPYYDPMCPPPPGYGQGTSGQHIGGYHESTVSGVLDRVIDELKLILHRDFNRRMIESTAFKTYETWWDNQERKYKEHLENKAAASEGQLPVIAKTKGETPLGGIAAVLEGRGEGFPSEGLFLGLGLRAAMPKMPSFKRIRKIKPPSPPQFDEDSRGDISEGDVKVGPRVSRVGESSDSDSGPDDLLPSGVRKKPSSSVTAIKKKPKWSSDEDSDESSVSSEDEEQKESSSSSSGSTSNSSSSESESEPTEKEDELEIKELRRLEAEFDAHVKSTLESVLRTPERERSATPLPELGEVEDGGAWSAPASPAHKELPASTTVSPAKTSNLKGQKELKLILTDMKHQVKAGRKVGKRKRISRPSGDASSNTDTADEDNNLDDSIKKDGKGKGVKTTPLPPSEKEGVNGRVHSPSSSSSSSDKGSIEEQRSPVLMEHSYCLPWVSKEGIENEETNLEPSGTSGRLDHDYTRAGTLPIAPGSTKVSKIKPVKAPPKGKENRALTLKQALKKQKSAAVTHYRLRNQMEEYNTLYSFLMQGIDQEDINLLKRSYERMLADDTTSYWLNDTHWVNHPPTDLPLVHKRRRVDELPLHKSGCARTEGIYKVDSKQKQKHKFTFHEDLAVLAGPAGPQSLAVMESSKTKLTQVAVNREVRSFQRRLLTEFGTEIADSDLLKFNQLKFRKKALRFGKSRIHDWGLFAMEAIAAEEMVIEYVGQSVRSIIADIREIQYERVGIGSSYLFRIDLENIIDATKCGNLARFINHSCSTTTDHGLTTT